MRILYVLNSGQPGGMEHHILDLVKGMTARNHEVYVWCIDGPIAELYENVGAEVTKRKVGFDFDPFYIADLTTFLRKNKIDVLHAHELKAVVNALFAGFFAKTPVSISHTHTPISEWQINTLKKKINILIYSFVVNLFSTVEIALTDSRKRVKIGEGIKQSKLSVIPNGVDLQKFDVSSSRRFKYKDEMCEKYDVPRDRFIFGNVSRLTEEKGHETLISAFARLSDYKEIDKNNVHLLIAGGGRLEEKLRTKVDEFDLKDHITITERFPDEDHIKLYSTFDAFVFPSLAEGFGIVLIEAMAMGLPIICSNLEVLEEVGGSAVFSYFETGDAQNLSEKMHELYMKRDILGNTVKNAINRVNDLYSVEKFVTNYENLYRDLL